MVDNLMMTMAVLAIVSVIGIVSAVLICFAGYRLMRFTLVYIGFGLGLSIGVSTGMLSEIIVVAVILGIIFGVATAILSFKFRDVATVIVSGVLVAAIFYYLIGSVLVAVVFGIGAAALSIFYVRYTFITVTSFFGSGLLLVSTCRIMGIISLMAPIYILWLIIAFSGVLCQLLTTYDRHKQNMLKKYIILIKNDNRELTFSEEKYPGMQRAYRNFCINCGCELVGENKKCPRCKFEIKD